ncbi:MAG: alpha-1,3-galactosidase B [Clostridia bacterium]|nr:alpha-1,3-galactosidase B [Clostridia bacterium]
MYPVRTFISHVQKNNCKGEAGYGSSAACRVFRSPATVSMKTIFLSECGITPDRDWLPALAELFRSNPADCEFVFAPGDYRLTGWQQRPLSLSNTVSLPVRNLGIVLENMKNIRIKGSGARLFCEGRMQPLTLLGCENISVEDFAIDWKKPMVAEGIVTAFSDSSVDLFIDPDVFPHTFEDGKLLFDIGGYSSEICGIMQFDANTRTVRRTTGDDFDLGAVLEALGDHVYRFAASHPDTAVGNIVVLRHNEREHAGIFAEKSRNLTFERIDFYSCGGLGCLCQFCDTLIFREVNFLPNRAAGRTVVSGRDDGMHITCCKGTVTVEGCSFLGLMDDPINVHSCCVPAAEWLDEKTVRCRYGHRDAHGFESWAEPGDEIVFIDRKCLAQLGTARAVSFLREDDKTFVLTLDQAVPDAIRAGNIAVDNISNTASFVCENNRLGSCRARGVLISTPKPVVIRNNWFESSGSAILVAGDANGWFESGECHDVEIEGNIFTDSCLSSMYQFCEGVISVCPVVPKPETDKPFHKNIRIHDNVFDSPDVPVLYGFSCDGLRFENNRIFKSPRAEKWHPGKAMIRLEYCRNAVVFGNIWEGPFSLERFSADPETCTFTTDETGQDK